MATAITSAHRSPARHPAPPARFDVRQAVARVRASQIATLAPYVCRACGAGAMASGRCRQDGGELWARGTDAVLGTMIGPYRIARRIGAGGMGTVYRAQHLALRSAVAVKVMHAGDTRDRQRFAAEVRAANLLSHRNIAPVLDLGELPDGRPYYVMPLLDGVTLDARLRRGRLSTAELADWFGQLLAAVGAAHAQQIVHRDLKPTNVFIGDDGVVRLLDFGVAKLAPSLGGVQSLHGSVVGTPEYMAPEQTCGLPVDGRADIYAIGVMLFEALVGALPFDGAGERRDLLVQQRTQPAPCVRAQRPDVAPALAAVVARAMAKSLTERYQSAAAMAAALMAACPAVAPAAVLPEITAAWLPSARHRAPLPVAPARLADGTGPLVRGELRTIDERPVAAPAWRRLARPVPVAALLAAGITGGALALVLTMI